MWLLHVPYKCFSASFLFDMMVFYTATKCNSETGTNVLKKNVPPTLKLLPSLTMKIEAAVLSETLLLIYEWRGFWRPLCQYSPPREIYTSHFVFSSLPTFCVIRNQDPNIFFIWPRYGAVAGYCEHSDEPSCFVKCGKILACATGRSSVALVESGLRHVRKGIHSRLVLIFLVITSWLAVRFTQSHIGSSLQIMRLQL
jgi:hypothetical protein